MATGGVVAKMIFLIICLLTCSGNIEPCINNNNNAADVESSISRKEFKEVLSGGKGLKIVHQNIRGLEVNFDNCLLYTSPSPRDKRQSRMPSSA